jgi:hypothetical protein
MRASGVHDRLNHMNDDDDVDWIAFAALSADDSIEPAEAMAGSMRDPEPDDQRSLPAWIVAASHSFLMICSGLCFLPFIENLLAQSGAGNSHTTWISFWGARQINESGSFGGYTLIAPMNSTSTYLIDTDGRVVHEWKSKYAPALSAFLLEDGHLLRT